VTFLSAALFLVGCSSEQEQSEKQETSSEAAAETTAETTTAERTAAEETGEEASSSSPEGRSPDEVLALQYEYINRGDFQQAYSLFDQQSRQEVSLEQYRAFFEANAPYSVTDYSFSPAQEQGNSATVDSEFTVNSASGVEQLQRTQRFVRENGEWRVVMRPEQVAAFTATSDPANSAPVEEEADQANAPSKSKVEAPRPKQAPQTERGAPASEIVVRISGTAGVPYKGDISGRSEARDGQQPIEGTIGQGQNEYRLLDIVGDVQVRNVQAGARKSRPGIEGDLRVEILYEGVVMADKVATGTAGSAVTS
jgi:hypothetical protein